MFSKSLVLKNTLYQVIGKGISIACSLLTVSLLTNYFGVEGWGNYVFLTTSVLLSFNLADWGVAAVTIRKWVRVKNKREVLGDALFLKVFLSFFAFLVFNLLAFFLPQFASLRPYSFLASLTIFFLTLRTGADIFFIARQELGRKVFFEALSSLLFLFLIWVFLKFFTLSFYQLVLFWLLAAAVAGLAALILVFKQQGFKLRFSYSRIRGLFVQAFPLGLRQMIFAVYDEGIDSFFLKTFLGAAAVGYYGLAYKVYGNLVLLAAFFMNSLLAVLSREKPRLREKIFFAAAKFLLFLGLLVGGVTFFTAPWLINLLGGASFLPAVKALRILSGALVFSFLNHLVGYTLLALGKQKRLLYFSLACLLVNLLGNYFLIPRGGVVAAALVTLMTEATMFFLGIGFVRREIKK